MLAELPVLRHCVHGLSCQIHRQINLESPRLSYIVLLILLFTNKLVYIHTLLSNTVVWVVAGILVEIYMQSTWGLTTTWDLPINLGLVLMQLLKPRASMVLARAALGMR